MSRIHVATALTLLGALSVPSHASAELWCAEPLWVHEWGVQVFRSDSTRRAAVPGPQVPRHFHHRATRPQAAGPPVRQLPADSGVRALPVVHFYAPRTWRPVPVGFEVGFAEGDATRWYPQVDHRTPAVIANGPGARRTRARLLTARAARAPSGAYDPAAIGRDPTRQLAWDHLSMGASPQHRRAPAEVPWVTRLRGFDSALWLNGAHQSERFLFYEGTTRERSAVRVERGDTYAPGRRHYILRNTGSAPVHDVFFVHREDGRRYVFFAPTIAVGATAGFLLAKHVVPSSAFAARTREALRERLIDAQQPAPPANYRWSDCRTQRDPAIPTEAATGHRLYAHEIDVVLDLWNASFFEGAGTTIVYRESTAYLDRVMPISVYTDMFHFVELRRLGLAVARPAGLP